MFGRDNLEKEMLELRLKTCATFARAAIKRINAIVEDKFKENREPTKTYVVVSVDELESIKFLASRILEQ